ncbi:TonB-dependent receptor [Tunturiibacter empetritectus]|uniref:TonB-dependent transporter Oar-like beta-barrel domain-containing protein n=1 Tax=Tunturiibacter lichenicola TaxID=2051959 RepID=A0A852VFF8_9BACT|nr:TonB-dependent receptor [Edaphobacter lichenicola]NYF91553.1 hypothetical protein [Edaphobacter lichenicola]
MSRIIRVKFLLLAVMAWGTRGAIAQVGTAQLNGTVHDAGGAVIPKATVTLRDVATNRAYTTSTNDSGFYAQTSVSPGSYSLMVEANGFSKSIQNGIVLSVGQIASIDVGLTVAAAKQDVVVTTETLPLDTSRTEVSQVITTSQIQSLPISGRLFTDFALLTPGVATGRSSLQSTFTETEVTRISFGGQRDFSNEITIDGADNINTVTGSQRATPSQEAVAEFRVVNSSFGTETGRALGGLVDIVTKSGTNDLHGSVYDYFQNNATNARSILQPAPEADTLRQNQFGATLGGPIRKDKTFFFSNYEGQRRGESPTYPVTLLNDFALFNAAKSALNIAPETLNVLKTADSDNGFIKVDHELNKSNRLAVRYNIYDSRSLNLLVGDTLDGGGIAAPSGGHNAFIRDQSLVGVFNSVINSALVNTFLGQYARRHYDFPGATGQPTLDIPNTLQFGHNFGVFDQINESRLQFSDTVAWVKGSHVAKFGVDTNYLNDFVLSPGFTPMRIVLPGASCLVEFANYVNPAANLQQNPADGPCPVPNSLHGVPIVFWGAPIGHGPLAPGYLPPPIDTSWASPFVPSLRSDFNDPLNHGYFGFFAQDQWHITPTLNLTYGLRYDFETGLSTQINPDYRGFQPRVGLAYSLNKKTTVRAGFGLFDDRYNLTFIFTTRLQRPVVIPNATLPGVQYNSDTLPFSLNQLTPGPPLPNGQTITPADAAATLVKTGQVPPSFLTGPQGTTVPGSADLVDHNSRIPYSEQANFAIDRELGKGFVLDVAYLFVAGHKLLRPQNLNVCPPGGLSNAATNCPAAGPKPPDWPTGKDTFSGPLYTNAGLLYFTDNTGNTAYNGVTVQIVGNIAPYFRLNANYTFSKTFDNGTFATFVSTPQDQYKRNLERALSNQDVRHRFIGNFTATAPQKKFVRNFDLSGIVNLQSGRPFTEFVGFDANGDTNPVTDRVGDAGRNTYLGDKLITADLRLQRTIKFEFGQLALAVDGFNTFNRANVNEVTSVYGTYNYCGGQIPKQYKDTVSRSIQQGSTVSCPTGGPPTPNPLFGTPRTVFNPRQLQFSAKFVF